MGAIHMANLCGAAAGSLVTGFVLMELWSLQSIALLLALTGLAAAALLTPSLRPGRWLLPALTSLALVAWWSSDPLFAHIYERLLKKTEYPEGYEFRQVIENRSGVISVTPTGRVFGTGAYDGVFNTKLVNDRNGIARAYAIGMLHPTPREVFMVGLASGSWAQVVAHHPGVEKLTIVEINPSYRAIVRDHPAVASVLENPKVEIISDDARRWLAAHEGRRYDLVVMNTIHHWRAHSSHLLSREFMAAVRRHLKPGGVMYYNSTRSERAQLTGASYFPHALRLSGMIAVSDQPILINKPRWQQYLRDFSIDGRRVLRLEEAAHRRRLAELAALPDTLDGEPQKYGMERRRSLLTRLSGLAPITQDNMGHEWSRF